MLAEYPELLIRPLKPNAGYERLFRPIQLAPQITGTYIGFWKFGRSIGGDFPTRYETDRHTPSRFCHRFGSSVAKAFRTFDWENPNCRAILAGVMPALKAARTTFI
jgi:hypothetical protein